MKTSQLFAASILALATSAFAAPSYIADQPDLFAQEAQAAQTAQVSRAQAQAASRAGVDEANLFADVAASKVTRTAVKAQAAQQAAAIDFTNNPVFTDALIGKSNLTRAEVRAEAAKAVRSGS